MRKKGDKELTLPLKWDIIDTHGIFSFENIFGKFMVRKERTEKNV